MEKIIRIAIQKKGRLNEKTVQLFKECGFEYYASKNALKSRIDNFPAEVYFIRDDDVPKYVAEKTADLGIVGENEVLEKDLDVDITERLGFGKCRLSLAVPKEADYTGIQWLEGKKIATSYPVILEKLLRREGVNAEITEITGSVEIAPGIGLADAICDLVSTGSTLMSNGLKEVQVVMKSEALLIQSTDLEDWQQAIIDKLVFRLHAVQKAKKFKYISLNVPNDSIEKVKEILPGMKSPTVIPLVEEGWSSMHSVIKETEFWNIIDKLKEAGAQGILVSNIEKMIL